MSGQADSEGDAWLAQKVSTTCQEVTSDASASFDKVIEWQMFWASLGSSDHAL